MGQVVGLSIQDSDSNNRVVSTSNNNINSNNNNYQEPVIEELDSMDFDCDTEDVVDVQNNNSNASSLIDQGDFLYVSESFYIPDSMDDIDENVEKIKSEIVDLNHENEELTSEVERLQGLKEDFDYNEDLKSEYLLDIDNSGRILDPYEYEKKQRTDNSLAYTNPDWSFDEEKLAKAVADYTERYNQALSISTNGEFSDFKKLCTDIGSKKCDIAENNENIRLKNDELKEVGFDNYVLTDTFQRNYNNESSYIDKMNSDEYDYDYCKDIVLGMKDIGNQNDAEDYFKEITGIDLSVYDLLECLAEEKYGISPEKLRTLSKEEAEEFQIELQGEGYNWANNAYDIYKYLNDKQLAMIKTIAEKDGLDKSREYYECIEEKITSMQGMEEAMNFFSTLLEDSGYNLEDVKMIVNQEGKYVILTKNENGEYEPNYDLSTNLNTMLSSFNEGVGDGIEGFFDGIANLFNDSDNRSKSDYKKLYIASFLKDFVILKGSYDVGNGVGNLFPSVALTALIGLAGAPAAFQSNFGYILLGLSTAGNSYHNYRIEGYEGAEVIIGSIMNGLVEYATGRLFGRIPWLNEEANVVFSEFLKNGTNIFNSVEWGQLFLAIGNNMLHEGVEEFIQSYFEDGIDSYVEGKPFDLEGTTNDALYSFLIGALVSGLLTGANTTLEITYAGVNYVMTRDDIIKLLSNIDTSNETTEEGKIRKIVEYLNQNNASDISIKTDDNGNFIILNQYSDAEVSTEQLIQGIDNLSTNHPAYQERLDQLKQKIENGTYTSDDAVKELSLIFNDILENDWNYDFSHGNYDENKQRIKRLIMGLSNAGNFEVLPDGTFRYSDANKGIVNSEALMRYLLSNNLNIDKDTYKVIATLQGELDKVKEFYSNAEVTDFAGSASYMESRANHIAEGYISLLNSQYITESERTTLLTYQDDISRIQAEINSIYENSKDGISREDYNRMSELYKEMEKIEKEASRINANAWERFSNDPSKNAVLIHTFSNGVYSYSDFDKPKICTSLLTDSSGTTFAVHSGCGMIFEPDMDSIDTIALQDAGSFDYNKERLLSDIFDGASLDKNQVNGTGIKYEGGDHTTLYSPEAMENSINSLRQQNISYTEIVLYNNSDTKPTAYFITDEATDETVAQMKELAKQDGIPLVKIDSQTFERTPVDLD